MISLDTVINTSSTVRIIEKECNLIHKTFKNFKMIRIGKKFCSIDFSKDSIVVFKIIQAFKK